MDLVWLTSREEERKRMTHSVSALGEERKRTHSVSALERRERGQLTL